MIDLVAWLRQKIDEDEWVAREAVDDYYYLDEGEATLRFLEHHDPARVLAEVAAKRAILDLHKNVDGLCDCCYMDRAPCETIRLLAQPLAGRPGWREEWRT